MHNVAIVRTMTEIKDFLKFFGNMRAIMTIFVVWPPKLAKISQTRRNYFHYAPFAWTYRNNDARHHDGKH
jgi:hypothetical protein